MSFTFKWIVHLLDHYKDPVRKALLVDVPNTGDYCLRLELQLRALAARTNRYGAIKTKNGKNYSIRILSSEVDAPNEAVLKDSLEQLARHELIWFNRPILLEPNLELDLAIPWHRWLECLPEKLRRAEQNKRYVAKFRNTLPVHLLSNSDLLKEDVSTYFECKSLTHSDLEIHVSTERRIEKEISSSSIKKNKDDEEEEVLASLQQFQVLRSENPNKLRKLVQKHGNLVLEAAKEVERSLKAGFSIKFPLRALQTALSGEWDSPPRKIIKPQIQSVLISIPPPPEPTPQPVWSSEARHAWAGIRQRLEELVGSEAVDRWFKDCVLVANADRTLTLWCKNSDFAERINMDYKRQLHAATEQRVIYVTC